MRPSSIQNIGVSSVTSADLMVVTVALAVAFQMVKSLPTLVMREMKWNSAGVMMNMQI